MRDKKLDAHLSSIADNVTRDMADIAKLTLEDSVQYMVYGAYIPHISGYNRTNTLKNSITVLDYNKSKNGSQAIIGHDYSMMNYTSVYGKKVAPEMIVDIVNKGFLYGAIKHKGYWHERRDYNPTVHTFIESRPYFQTAKNMLAVTLTSSMDNIVSKYGDFI